MEDKLKIDPKSKIVNPPNILEKLKIDVSGVIIFNDQVATNKYEVSLVPHHKMDDHKDLLMEIKTECLSELKKELNYRPKINELVCGLSTEDEWYRAIVLSIHLNIQLAAIDEARVFSPIKVVPIPYKKRDICTFGLICTIVKDDPMLAGELLTSNVQPFAVIKTSKSGDSVFIEITFMDDNDDPGSQAQAEISKWITKLEKTKVKHAVFLSGHKVVIIDISSQNVIVAQSQEKEEVERVLILEQKISKSSQNRKLLDKPPVVGQIVTAQYPLDGNFYRAKVAKIVADDVLIEYIDYENEELTSVDNYLNYLKN